MQFWKNVDSFVDQYLIQVEKYSFQIFCQILKLLFLMRSKLREIAKELPYDFG
jgi:hypothetical protein